MADRPNLFSFATSELSQDAFLAWLLAWASPPNREIDAVLHQTGVALLAAMFDLCGEPRPSITSLDIRKQVEGLDILVLVNESHAVLIEDKTNTSEHSGQLTRYRRAVDERWPERRQVPIYFKSTEQGSYKGVESVGFKVLSRQQLLNILRAARSAGSRNAILEDYLEHLERIDRAIEAYATRALTEWSPFGFEWQGFFVRLQRELGGGEWSYVANPSGGFMGYWWHSRTVGALSLYLQLEGNALCFKVDLGSTATDVAAPRRWRDRLLMVAKDSGTPVEGGRLGRGRWVTFARWRGDYRVADAQGRLDPTQTVEVLRRAQDLLDRAIAKPA